jgi:nicotinamidase/pyrazinamidase
MANSSASALLIVDVQNDFCPGGALPVPHGDLVVPAINRYIAEASARGLPVYASRDWHPERTTHFAAFGGEWPVHCVQGSNGARFRDDLQLPPSTVVVTKGERADHPGYSAFDGHAEDGASLLSLLKARHVTHLFVGGLATDYCVKHTVLDARAAGLDVTVLSDAISGVDVHPGDSVRAMAEMRDAGARLAAGHGLL